MRAPRGLGLFLLLALSIAVPHAVVVLVGLLVVSCGAGRTQRDAGTVVDSGGDAQTDAEVGDVCYDNDDDGAGWGGRCARHDCDDTDPATIDQCGRGCDDRPLRAGCPCGSVGEVIDCFMGPKGTSVVGACLGGRKECTVDGWGTCDGQWLPHEEECNRSDDDCDGTVDDGVLSVCGGCDPCLCFGIGGEQPFQPTPGGPIALKGDGSIRLDPGWRGPQVLWVANTGDGTVSKLDPRDRRELARYRTWSDPASEPATTIVNPNGDVVVVNRVAGGATKILGTNCPDLDGDGVVVSSAAGDDVLDWSQLFGRIDECIVWNQPDLGVVSSAAFEVREVLEGHLPELVWLATELAGEGTIVEVDSLDGRPTGVVIPATEAVALAMGPGGLLWSVAADGCPVSTDTTTLEQVRHPCPPGGGEASALAVDAHGRVWIGGSVARLDVGTGMWDRPIVPTTSTGLALDRRGNAWTGEGDAGGYRIDATTLVATALPGMGGRGWAEDVDGFVWSVDLTTNGAHVLDPVTGEVEDVLPPFDAPEGSGDLTGTALLTITPPFGRQEASFGTCSPNWTRNWIRLVFAADLPGDSSIAFSVRQPWEIDQAPLSDWIPAALAPRDASPVDLDAVFAAHGVEDDREWVQVQAVLRSADPANGPTLRTLCIEHAGCWIE